MSINVTRHWVYQDTIAIDFYEQLGNMKHVYKLGNEFIDGVTTTLKVIDKPLLIPWAAKKAVESFYQDMVSINGKVNAVDLVGLDSIAKKAKSAYKVHADDAATIGRKAHLWIEHYIKGRIAGNEAHVIPQMPDEPEVFNAVRAFLDNEAQHISYYILSERLVFSKEFNYVGTLDIIAVRHDGSLALVDLKTSSGIYDEMYIQLAAYAHAYTEETGKEIACALIFRIGKDGEFELGYMHKQELDQCFEAFVHALELKRTLKWLKKLLSKGEQR
jgi:hypothetical protein